MLGLCWCIMAFDRQGEVTKASIGFQLASCYGIHDRFILVEYDLSTELTKDSRHIGVIRTGTQRENKESQTDQYIPILMQHPTSGNAAILVAV